MKTLCIIDVQNDFCHPKGFFAKKLKFNISKVDAVVERIEKVLTFWRNSGWEVIWVKALGDPEYLSKTQFKRRQASGKLKLLRDRTWGSDFYKITPQKNEAIFKKGGYDPFVNQEFKRLILKRTKITLVGFFSDVCIHATAHSADSLGIETSLIKKCSLPMFYPYHKSLKFLESFFGTRIMQIKDILT